MNTRQDHVDSIAADVEHNFQLFKDLARSEIAKLQSFMNKDIYTEKDTMDMIKKIDFKVVGLSADIRKTLASL
jgi:hypothetical protein